MKETTIRAMLLLQHMKFAKERDEYLAKALATEDWEEKDVLYRKAAVAALRIDSVANVVEQIKGMGAGLKMQRVLQKHTRDMARLKYTERPAHMQSDGLDMEVMSQFFQSEDPEQNRLYSELMTMRKLKPRDPAKSDIQLSQGPYMGS